MRVRAPWNDGSDAGCRAGHNGRPAGGKVHDGHNGRPASAIISGVRAFLLVLSFSFGVQLKLVVNMKHGRVADTV